MEYIIGLIIAVVVFYFLMVLFFKLCNISEKVTFFFMVVANLGLIISSFAMPWIKDTYYTSQMQETELPFWILAQGFFLYLYYVTQYACIAFDREEYVETNVSYNDWTDTFHSESHLVSKNMVWSVIGVGLLFAGGLLLLNYLVLASVFNSLADTRYENPNAIGLGIIGCIFLIRTVYVFVRDHRRRRDYY